MKYVFYITNHGFGHASRNVPIILELARRDIDAEFIIKTDHERCEFLKRNLQEKQVNTRYYPDYSEVGLVLQPGMLIPDIPRMRKEVISDISRWENYISKETIFLKNERPDVVICDIIGWVLKAAKKQSIPSLLLGNFTWSSMYSSFFNTEIVDAYKEMYSLADKAIWYEIHDAQLEFLCKDYQNVSLISRDIDYVEVERIKNQYKASPTVFISLGASADIKEELDVSKMPYTFLTTRGVSLRGSNVTELPLDMINTPDYIAAADYVIAKGGWSTVAEILLQKKKAALLFRGNNTEDNATKRYLESRQQIVAINSYDLRNIDVIIDKINALKPEMYSYNDSREIICDAINQLCRK